MLNRRSMRKKARTQVVYCVINHVQLAKGCKFSVWVWRLVGWVSLGKSEFRFFLTFMNENAGGMLNHPNLLSQTKKNINYFNIT